MDDCKTHLRQHGVALVTVLLVVALASAAAVAVAARQVIDVRRTENVVIAGQANLLVRGMETWVRQVLERDAVETKTDGPADTWSSLARPIEIEHGQILGRVEDLQGRFNLNNLITEQGEVSPDDVQGFERLLELLELDEDLAQAVADWLDSDIRPSYPGGAEDNDYLRRTPPYRTANRRIASPRELLLIKGFDEEAYARIAPFVTALPGRTDVNVNTATAPVLVAAIEELTLSQAEAMVESRGDSGYEDLTQFRNEQALEGREVKGVSVTSDYFLASFNVEYLKARRTAYSIMRRTGDDPVVAQTIMRERGEY